MDHGRLAAAPIVNTAVRELDSSPPHLGGAVSDRPRRSEDDAVTRIPRVVIDADCADGQRDIRLRGGCGRMARAAFQ